MNGSENTPKIIPNLSLARYVARFLKTYQRVTEFTIQFIALGGRNTELRLAVVVDSSSDKAGFLRCTMDPIVVVKTTIHVDDKHWNALLRA